VSGAWESALDEMERSADHWEPPTDLGPMPHDLADRARSLLARIDVEIATATAERGEVRSELDRLARPSRSRVDVAPSRFDHHV